MTETPLSPPYRWGKAKLREELKVPGYSGSRAGPPPEVLPPASGGHVTSHTTPGRSGSACPVSQHPSRSPGHPTAPHDSSRNNDQNRLAQAGAGLKADMPCVSGWDRERQLLFLLSISVPHHILSPVQRPPFLLEAFDPSFLFSATASAQGSGFNYSTFSTSFGLPGPERSSYSSLCSSHSLALKLSVAPYCLNPDRRGGWC